jgi:hypothetical protein
MLLFPKVEILSRWSGIVNVVAFMKFPIKPLTPAMFRALVVTTVAVILLARATFVRRVQPPPTQPPPLAHMQSTSTVTNQANTPPSLMAVNAVKSPAREADLSANHPDFQKRPFPVALQKANYQWTLADGRDTNVIRQLAHNPLEYQRMVTENQTIYRRQLVYFSQGFDTLARHALQTGGSLHQISLPGLDGQVFSVDVQNTDLRDGGVRGQLYGQLPGQPNSMVTVAFAADREAFTILSPQDQVYLQAEAHEPGEVVVKSINPETYGQPHN